MQITQDFSIQVDNTVETPLFKQISEQIKHAIASSQIQPGKHLPTVRQLARSLGINPGTVSRAYLSLEQEKIVISRRGGGTIVATKADNSLVSKLRQRRLSSLVSNHILETLSLGYNPEELEAEFSLHLSRWREERKGREQTPEIQRRSAGYQADTIVMVGSHDLALDLLVNKLKSGHPGITVKLNHAGSLGGLIAMQEGRADLAGIHLLDEETGAYNYPYLKHLLPGRELALVHLAYRIQGLMFAKGNPRGISSFNDLGRRDITFVNRQKGSGTRVLLDFELRKHGIDPLKINGYEHEVETHLAVAMSVSRGKADVGLGIQAVADANELDFLPILRERYDLIIPIENYRNKLVQPLLEIATSTDFKAVVANIGGYDISQTGSITFFP
ncbi:MAG: substrate-binding domain-containing protein [Dehalococcoidales bacterium]|jgi:molybdate-binding protein/DNA-binding transcriptional regulator YhcF (GntR family)